LVLAFPWRITLGTFTTIGVALCFSTPDARRAAIRKINATQA
jgi:hypothetical protein